MKEKQFILDEIRRTAALNHGEPVGVRRFATETGIAEHEWRGTYWAKWGDALQEAGFAPLEWNTGLTVDEILQVLAKLVRKKGKYPTVSEILIEKKTQQAVPTPKALARKLGPKTEAIKKLYEYCLSKEEYADVSVILAREFNQSAVENASLDKGSSARGLKPSGYVYLVKSGKLYKIGQTANRWQRMSQLDRQTVEGIDQLIHTIYAYDDAPGIEAYWHRRFKEKSVRNEIFNLSADDIRAFKKRKWM